MKYKYIYFLLFFFSNSFILMSQNLDFIKNESLKEKLENVVTYIEKSETIQTNYRSWRGYNIYIVSDIYPKYSFEFRLETSINKDFITSKCIKINDYITWVFYDNCPMEGLCDLDETIFDISLLVDVGDCTNCIVSKRENKNIIPMINTSITYRKTEDGDYLLNGLLACDSTLFLSIEFGLNGYGN